MAASGGGRLHGISLFVLHVSTWVIYSVLLRQNVKPSIKMYTHPLLSLSTISMHPTLLHHNEIMSFHTLVSWDWRKEERENTPREARGIRELSQSRETKERLVHSIQWPLWSSILITPVSTSYPTSNWEERNVLTSSMEINHPPTLNATFLPPDHETAGRRRHRSWERTAPLDRSVRLEGIPLLPRSQSNSPLLGCRFLAFANISSSSTEQLRMLLARLKSPLGSATGKTTYPLICSTYGPRAHRVGDDDLGGLNG